MVSYEDVSGPISLHKHKRLAIQVESIKTRINNINDADLIIFDEIDSILTHISQHKSINSKLDGLIHAINTNSTKVFMDAYLTNNHIKLIQSIRECEYYTINNSYKPWEQHESLINGTK